MEERIYNAIILNEPYATQVMERIKSVETRMRRLSKFIGEFVICCDKGKSKDSPNAGKALCIVDVEKFRPMTKEDEDAACIECAEGRFAYPLSNWQYFSYNFQFSDYYVSGSYQGIFQIRIPDFVNIIPHK